MFQKKELEELRKKANVANVSIPTNLKEAIQSQVKSLSLSLKNKFSIKNEHIYM